MFGAFAAAAFSKEVGLPLAVVTAALVAFGVQRRRRDDGSANPSRQNGWRRWQTALITGGVLGGLLGVGFAIGLIPRLYGTAIQSLYTPRLGWHALTEARGFLDVSGAGGLAGGPLQRSPNRLDNLAARHRRLGGNRRAGHRNRPHSHDVVSTATAGGARGGRAGSRGVGGHQPSARQCQRRANGRIPHVPGHAPDLPAAGMGTGCHAPVCVRTLDAAAGRRPDGARRDRGGLSHHLGPARARLAQPRRARGQHRRAVPVQRPRAAGTPGSRHPRGPLGIGGRAAGRHPPGF